MAVSSTRIQFWMLAAALTLLCEPVSCGSLQKRPAILLDDPQQSVPNSTYYAPSLPPNPWAASSSPPSTKSTWVPDLSTGDVLSNIIESDIWSGVPVESGTWPAVPSTEDTQVLLATPTEAAASIALTDAPASSPGCTRYEPCNLFFQTVSVYYWPQESQNTACLTTMPAVPAPTPLGVPDIVSPEVYVVFDSIKASDGCNQIGSSFASRTTHFPPEALSTIAPDNTTQVFNFADLPCPPASVQWDPTTPYQPLLAPPQWLFDLDPAFKTCIAGYSQGHDPPALLASAGGVSGPHDGRHHSNGRRSLPHAHAHANPHARALARPWAPQKTA